MNELMKCTSFHRTKPYFASKALSKPTSLFIIIFAHENATTSRHITCAFFIDLFSRISK